MSVDMNLVIFGGRLTDDPTPLGDTGTGCRFDIASNRTYKDRDGTRQEATTYMSVTCWGPLAELVSERCSRGSAVIVEGRLEVRRIDGEDGASKKYTNIVARDVRFVDSRSSDDFSEEDAPQAPRRTTSSKAQSSERGADSAGGIDPKKMALLQQLLGS